MKLGNALPWIVNCQWSVVVENLSVTQKNLIKNIVSQCKFIEKSSLSEEKFRSISEIFEESSQISIPFCPKNPLSVMETTLVALYTIGASDIEVSNIFDISKNTVKSYSDRVKQKLQVNTKNKAVLHSIKSGIVKVIY